MADTNRLIGEWLLTQSRITPATKITYGRTMRSALRDLDPYTCDTPAVLAAVDATWNTGSGRTMARDTLRRFFAWMVENGLRDDNPIPARRHSKGGNGPAQQDAPEAWETHIDAWQRYLLALGRSVETRRTYRNIVIGYARSHPNGPQTSGDNLIEHLAAHPEWHPATRKQFVKAVTSFYRWAAPRGVADDPTGVLPRMNVPDAVPRPAADHVYRQAITNAAPREHLMLLLGAHGLRVREIVKVHSDDLTALGLYVTGKGGKRRLVPVTEELRHAIHQAGPGYVFPSRFHPGKPMHPSTIGKNLRKAMEGQASAHQLRHRFGTKAYQGTNNIRAVQLLLGHSDLATTCIYVDVASEDLAAAVQAANG